MQCFLGKVVLIAQTASKRTYTPQYQEELLYRKSLSR